MKKSPLPEKSFSPADATGIQATLSATRSAVTSATPARKDEFSGELGRIAGHLTARDRWLPLPVPTMNLDQVPESRNPSAPKSPCAIC